MTLLTPHSIFDPASSYRNNADVFFSTFFVAVMLLNVPYDIVMGNSRWYLAVDFAIALINLVTLRNELRKPVASVDPAAS